VYDGLDRNVQIVETQSGSTTSTKQFVWCGGARCEARNATGSITAQYFRYGQTIAGSNYYYSKDHLGSIRELTDGSGTVQASYSYDPYGRRIQLQGSLAPDFQYVGYYFHSPSALSITMTRFYSAALGRWASRDWIEEEGGPNLFSYVDNDPLDLDDITGTSSRKRRSGGKTKCLLSRIYPQPFYPRPILPIPFAPPVAYIPPGWLIPPGWYPPIFFPIDPPPYTQIPILPPGLSWVPPPNAWQGVPTPLPGETLPGYTIPWEPIQYPPVPGVPPPPDTPPWIPYPDLPILRPGIPQPGAPILH
jgi:RHS repeat-associated protein